MKRNQESTLAEGQATRQEREENAQGHQSRVEETQPLQGGENPEMVKESPFSLAILEEWLPPSFRQSNVGEYDGLTDPEKHLGRFENAALLHQYSDGVKCKVFLGTLVRSAQQWFNTLQPNSLRSFEDFSATFLHRFASSKRHQRNYLSLFVMKQQETETLREFIRRFNNAELDIPDASPDIMISVFTQGLRGGEYFKSLVKKPPSSYDDLLSRTKKYVNLEDAQRHKRMEQRPGGIRVEGAERGGRKRGARKREEDKTRGRGEFSSHVPLERSRDKVMEVKEPDGRLEKSQRVESSARLPSLDRREGSSSGSRQRSRPSPRRSQGPPWINQRFGERRGEGHAIPPLGQIVLPLSLGTDPRRITKMIAFTVVDIPSAYNGILGRPALKNFRAVASTYHQKLKFPVGKGVGVLREDQKVTRRCYEAVQEEQREKMDPEWEGLFRVIEKFNVGAYYLENAQGKALECLPP
ncbi:uncharacterized protein LOC142505374 [Primulina tabacum]|uniref:uncharacterized protein LOC142505374 n=1 Tax=Primulina tabacum TaxID=48773 RepID=UPI003F5A3A62